MRSGIKHYLKDIPLRLDLNLKYPNYKNLQKQFKFSSTSHSEEVKDNMEELLNDETLKKLEDGLLKTYK